eukprot:8890281-Ditylum_brightwellii.AAC.1
MFGVVLLMFFILTIKMERNSPSDSLGTIVFHVIFDDTYSTVSQGHDDSIEPPHWPDLVHYKRKKRFTCNYSKEGKLLLPPPLDPLWEHEDLMPSVEGDVDYSAGGGVTTDNTLDTDYNTKPLTDNNDISSLFSINDNYDTSICVDVVPEGNNAPEGSTSPEGDNNPVMSPEGDGNPVLAPKGDDDDTSFSVINNRLVEFYTGWYK